MAEKTTIKVLIDGKIMTLSGYETEEYLQRVSFYLNSKIEELKGLSGSNRLSQETKSSLLALNLADDYFKARSRAESLERDIEDKDRDAYADKQQLISLQMQIEKLQKELQTQNEKMQKEMERLRGRQQNGH